MLRYIFPKSNEFHLRTHYMLIVLRLLLDICYFETIRLTRFRNTPEHKRLKDGSPCYLLHEKVSNAICLWPFRTYQFYLIFYIIVHSDTNSRNRSHSSSHRFCIDLSVHTSGRYYPIPEELSPLIVQSTVRQSAFRVNRPIVFRCSPTFYPLRVVTSSWAADRSFLHYADLWRFGYCFLSDNYFAQKGWRTCWMLITIAMKEDKAHSGDPRSFGWDGWEHVYDDKNGQNVFSDQIGGTSQSISIALKAPGNLPIGLALKFREMLSRKVLTPIFCNNRYLQGVTWPVGSKAGGIV